MILLVLGLAVIGAFIIFGIYLRDSARVSKLVSGMSIESNIASVKALCKEDVATIKSLIDAATIVLKAHNHTRYCSCGSCKAIYNLAKEVKIAIDELIRHTVSNPEQQKQNEDTQREYEDLVIKLLPRDPSTSVFE